MTDAARPKATDDVRNFRPGQPAPATRYLEFRIEILLPGDGFFIANPDAAAVTVTFVGEGLEGPNLPNAISAGLSIKSSKIPQAGDLTPGGSLEFPNPSEGDTVYKWLPAQQNYSTHTFFFGSWDVVPTLDVAESVFYQANAALNWERDFEVTP